MQFYSLKKQRCNVSRHIEIRLAPPTLKGNEPFYFCIAHDNPKIRRFSIGAR